MYLPYRPLCRMVLLTIQWLLTYYWHRCCADACVRPSFLVRYWIHYWVPFSGYTVHFELTSRIKSTYLYRGKRIFQTISTSVLVVLPRLQDQELPMMWLRYGITKTMITISNERTNERTTRNFIWPSVWNNDWWIDRSIDRSIDWLIDPISLSLYMLPAVTCFVLLLFWMRW